MIQENVNLIARSIFLALVFATVAANASGQTYNPIFPPNGTGGGVAYCEDNNGVVPYCFVRLYTGVYLYTNGHFHENQSQPWSSVTPTQGSTGSSGYLPFTITTTRVGQAELLIVEDVYYGLWSYNDYAVGYSDIFWNDHPELWDRVGGTDTGADTGHGSTAYNHWMEINAAYGIYYACQDYQADHPAQTRFCMNDMALPFAGKFDILQNWNSPHAEHDRGKAVDVGDAGAGQCNATNGIPIALKSAFRQKCIDRGALPARSYLEPGHVHCGWGLQ